MIRREFLAASLGLSGYALMGTQTSAAERDPDLAAAIREYFAPLAATRDLSGVLRIERSGRISEVAFGFADWLKRTPIRRDTRFAAGSIAKSVVATVILKLAADKKLSLDAPVSRYLPAYRFGASMTVDQVLRHTAGLGRDVPDNERATFGTSGLVGWLNQRPPATAGTTEYSNIGYELLALIAESAASRSFKVLAQRIAFDPMRLRGSLLANHSVNWVSARPHEPGPPPSEVRPAANEFLAAGGQLFATVDDLARWGRAVRDGQPLSLRRDDGTLAGSVLQRKIQGRDALWMQGTVTGAGANVLVFPGEDVVIVSAMNLASFPLFNSELVLAALAFGVDPGAPPPRLAAVELGDAHRALAGEYQLPGLGPIRIAEADGEMRLTVIGPGWSYYLTPASEERLLFRKFNYSFAARRDSSGALIGLHAHLHMLGESPGDMDIERI